jgi:hypothetical protein
MYHPSRHTFSTKAFAQFLCVLSTALFFCLFPPGLSAQFSLGPTAGMAATGFRWPSDIRTNPASSPRPKFGLVGGIALELDVSKSTSIHADFLFSQKGGKLVSNVTNAVDGDTRYESTITLNYAELPILFRIYTPAKPIQFFAGAGLGASFGLFGRDEIAIRMYTNGGISQPSSRLVSNAKQDKAFFHSGSDGQEGSWESSTKRALKRVKSTNL